MSSCIISASLLRGIRDVFHSSPLLRVSKLKYSCLSYDPDSLDALDLLHLSVVRTDFIRCQKEHSAIRIWQTIFSALELYVACTAAASGRPSRLHGFGLCQHDLAQVHVVTRSMHRSHRWVSIFDFLLISVFFRGVYGLVWPFALRRCDGLVAFSGLIFYFVLVISYTLRLENFLSSIEALTELNEVLEALCGGVKTLDYEFFLTNLREWETH